MGLPRPIPPARVPLPLSTAARHFTPFGPPGSPRRGYNARRAPRHGQDHRHGKRAAAGVRAGGHQHRRPAPRQHAADSRSDRLEGARPDHPAARRALPVPRSRQPERLFPARRTHGRAHPQGRGRDHPRLDAPRLPGAFARGIAAQQGHHRAHGHRVAHQPEDPGAPGRDARVPARAPDRRRRGAAAGLREAAPRERARPLDRPRGEPRRAAREDHHEGVRPHRGRPRRHPPHGGGRAQAEDRAHARRQGGADRPVEVDPQRGRQQQGLGAVVRRHDGQPLPRRRTRSSCRASARR